MVNSTVFFFFSRMPCNDGRSSQASSRRSAILVPSEGLAKTQPHVIRLALFHTQHHPAAMLPVASSFDRELRVKILNLETHE